MGEREDEVARILRDAELVAKRFGTEFRMEVGDMESAMCPLCGAMCRSEIRQSSKCESCRCEFRIEKSGEVNQSVDVTNEENNEGGM